MFASKKRAQSNYRGLLAASLVVAFAAGCELAVDFDRSKIPTPASDGGVTPADASGDGNTSPVDAAVTDAGGDAVATDAGGDATTSDAGSDATTSDASAEAGDAGSDASDAATD